MEGKTSKSSPVNEQRRNFISGSISAGVLGAGIAAGLVPTLAQAQSGKKVDRMASYTADQLERVKQVLVAPPMVPAHDQVAKGKPKVIEVRLDVEEKQIELENGTMAWVSAFNGSVPGPLIVCHQHDYIELTLINPDTNMLAHNIDLHASTGQCHQLKPQKSIMIL